MSKKKNIIIENVSVIDAGAKGKSVAKAPDGRVIFVTNAVPGDVVDVQTTKKKSAYYEGFAVKFHQLSAERTTPVCSHFGYFLFGWWKSLSIICTIIKFLYLNLSKKNSKNGVEYGRSNNH